MDMRAWPREMNSIGPAGSPTSRQPTGWAYYRPLLVALRVTELRLFGLHPLPFHVLHLACFSVSVLLFYGLLRRCGCGMRTGLVAAAFFVIHPAHGFTTPWVANDGPVLVGLWTIAALWLMHGSAQAGHCRPTLLAGVLVCYLLALLTRESGLMLAPMLILFDSLMAGQACHTAARQSAAPAVGRVSKYRCLLYGMLAVEGLA
jgi:hypothetical protein